MLTVCVISLSRAYLGGIVESRDLDGVRDPAPRLRIMRCNKIGSGMFPFDTLEVLPLRFESEITYSLALRSVSLDVPYGLKPLFRC
ncbi:hypothetical protein L249_7021 [Ophiocordyceps polyrhachis-furcata BCC 54312]|uniref:Uncharacterized protein n=1 Tax=Ophiocordyceps polyrhachis-furcata BCC 54312 TaxID=1330021 RepID=A0A367LL07_9HYPO|nr:hypothetical protein L249_7021 [Ophiocordyceps polyrhachis-furcata BCC 54312]